MNKADKDKYPPEYLFWRKRIEGQIRHTMYEHPEFFTKIAYEKNLVGRMAKRIIGEIVAGTTTGNNSRECVTAHAFSVNEDAVESRTASSMVASGTAPTGHLLNKQQIEEWASNRADDAGCLSRQLLDTMRENERLREGLRFYADGFGYEQELDNGKKAAEALSSKTSDGL